MKEGLENIVLGAQIGGRNIRLTYDISSVYDCDMSWAKELMGNLNRLIEKPQSTMGDVGPLMGNLLMIRVKIGTKQMEDFHI